MYINNNCKKVIASIKINVNYDMQESRIGSAVTVFKLVKRH